MALDPHLICADPEPAVFLDADPDADPDAEPDTAEHNCNEEFFAVLTP